MWCDRYYLYLPYSCVIAIYKSSYNVCVVSTWSKVHNTLHACRSKYVIFSKLCCTTCLVENIYKISMKRGRSRIGVRRPTHKMHLSSFYWIVLAASCMTAEFILDRNGLVLLHQNERVLYTKLPAVNWLLNLKNDSFVKSLTQVSAKVLDLGWLL